MIGGFEQPTEGTIEINGVDMTVTPPYRRPVNTVFQNYALFPHLTVGQNVAFGLSVKKVPKQERNKKVAAALEMVQLKDFEDRRPGQLSGGQQQRVALARALVNEPKVLLLDEPLGALDLKLRKEMQMELKELQQSLGITFIYVTHDQEEALTMSDRIAVMSFGKIMQVDSPPELYNHPKNRFVAEFIGDMNFLDGQVLSIKNGKIELKVGGKQLQTITNGLKLSENQRVTFALRPEKLELTKGKRGNDHKCLLRGTIIDSVFVGSDIRYRVNLDNGEEVNVLERNLVESENHFYDQGERVQVLFDPRDARVLEQ